MTGQKLLFILSFLIGKVQVLTLYSSHSGTIIQLLCFLESFHLILLLTIEFTHSRHEFAISIVLCTPADPGGLNTIFIYLGGQIFIFRKKYYRSIYFFRP